jgi:hypothetical protein
MVPVLMVPVLMVPVLMVPGVGRDGADGRRLMDGA